MMYLYKFNSTNIKDKFFDNRDEIDLKVFTPSLRAFSIKGKKSK